ncbi:MAG: family 16 glycosylhydrolase [Lewinellaceae bacterium]|nr:family 16 glycosylhydrolase [Lewinellaceae bacterium]
MMDKKMRLLMGLCLLLGADVQAQRCNKVLRLYPESDVPAAQRENSMLVFADNFDGDRIDFSSWDLSKPGDTRWECDRESMPSPQNVKVQDGLAYFTITKDSIGGCKYSTGEIKSFGKQDGFRPWKLQPGAYLEIRAKLPLQGNAGSAGWLWYWWGEQNIYREIDLWETDARYPDRFQSNIHYQPGPGEAQWVCLEDKNGQALRLDEHFFRYGLEWEKDRLRFYLNDQLFREIVIADPALWFDWDMDFLLGSQTASLNGDAFTEAQLPVTMAVDYVRVFQKSGSTIAAPVNPPTSIAPSEAFGIRAKPWPKAEYTLESPEYTVEQIADDWAVFWWLTPLKPFPPGSWQFVRYSVRLETGVEEHWYCPLYIRAAGQLPLASVPFREQDLAYFKKWKQLNIKP